jgi:hypothetical protein
MTLVQTRAGSAGGLPRTVLQRLSSFPTALNAAFADVVD